MVKGCVDMKNVLIDNWSLEELVIDLNNPQRLLKNAAFHNILEAIVLWDNIYFHNNEHAEFWNYMSDEMDFRDFLSEYHDNNEFFKSSELLYEKYCKDNYTKNLACGAIRYSLIAENLGFDYLPCEKRGQFIQESGIYSIMSEEKGVYVNGHINNPITRLDFCEPVNHEIKSYYKEFNDFYGKNVFELKLPVLANYIINTKPQEMSYFEYAKSLKKSLSVKLFLNYLKDIETEISKGNFIPCNRFKNDVKELVEDICKIDNKFIISIDGSLIPKPILNFDVFKIRKINYNFLKKIIKFSV